MKYLSNGQAVEVLEETKTNKFVVKTIYKDEESEEAWSAGDAFIVDRVFDKAPVELFDADIEKRESKINTLHTEERLLSTKIREMNQEFDALVKRCEKYDALKNVFSFIDGKITHYVISGWSSIDIIEFKTSLCNGTERYERKEFCLEKIKMLTLFGKAKGNLEWQLSEYRDNSGTSTFCYPCLSYEEALNKAKELIYESIEKTKDNPSQYTIDSAQKLGIELPVEYINAMNERKIANILSNINTKKEELKKWETDLLSFGVDMNFEEARP